MNMIRNFVLSLSAVLLLTTGCNAQSTNKGFENRTSDQVVDIEKEPNVVLIDVRTPGEVKSGYLVGTDLFFDIGSSDFRQKVLDLDRKKTYVLICASGARSSSAAQFMLDNGFEKVINMTGGMRTVRNNNHIVRP